MNRRGFFGLAVVPLAAPLAAATGRPKPPPRSPEVNFGAARYLQQQIAVTGEGSTATMTVKISDDGINWRDATWLTHAHD